MKFMEKAKRFFTLSAKHEGFTLVELIVVIAILAILAGVAIPAYSGYIKKAQEAGDQTLLAAINKAFAAACMVEGVDAISLPNGGPKIHVDENTGAIEYKEPEALRGHFDEFFAGNEDSTFEVIKKLEFENGVFVDAAKASGTTVTFFGQKYSISNNSLNAFKGSVYAQNVPAMQEQLNGVSNAFSDFIGNAATAGTISPKFEQYMRDNGYTDDQLGNAAVLYIAGNASDYSAQDVAQMFQNASNYMKENDDHSMKGMLEGAFGEGDDALTNAALMYGAVTAYANSDKCTDPNLKNQVANVGSGSDLMNVFMGLQNDSGWSSYLGTTENGQVTASSQFTTDMNGFLGAMDAIDSVSGGVDMNDTDFWKSEDVSGLLSSLGY